MNKQGSAKGKENTSYSAMLNIAELVAPPECLPFNSTYSRNQFQFCSIPDFQEFRPIPSNSFWTEFRNFGNWMELVPQCSTSRNRMIAQEKLTDPLIISLIVMRRCLHWFPSAFSWNIFFWTEVKQGVSGVWSEWKKQNTKSNSSIKSILNSYL